jgi:hypothetical protein
MATRERAVLRSSRQIAFAFRPAKPFVTRALVDTGAVLALVNRATSIMRLR